MNQIIFPEKNTNDLIEYKNVISKKHKVYKAVFIFSALALFSFIGYYIFRSITITNKSKLTERILSTYDVQQLYTSSSNFEKPIEMPHIISEDGNIADIIGIIEIQKLNLRYPILSETTDEFLKIAPCKFHGPEINTNGNFCIAGHNYDNGDFFSDIHLLGKNDVIDIYSLNRK